MSHAKNALLIGLLAVAVAGCTQNDQAGAQPAANAPADAAGPAAPATPAITPQAPRVLTAEEVAQQRLPQQASCNIETINGVRLKSEPFQTPPKGVVFAGWLLPEISKKTGVDAEIRVIDATGTAGWQFKINRWMPRPEVNAAMKALDDGQTGFAQPADLSTLPKGNYKLLITFRSNGTPYVCNNGRQLTIQ
jgi:hypothetical protein